MLSELIFGKKLNEISLSDLQEFFSVEQEESSMLEFKTGDTRIDSIYKEICAFLNTEGGVIIIGTPTEGKSKPSEVSQKTFNKGSLTYSDFRNKDWLIQKITSNISPPPVGIKIQEFLTEEGNHFIIDVAQSMTPPHQCNSNGAYYIRMEREAKAAPHGIVEALFFRRQKPKLDIKLSMETNDDDETVYLNAQINNASSFPTEKTSYMITFMNVEAVFFDDNENPIKSNNGVVNHQHTSTSVLWKGLSLNLKFKILSSCKPFFFSLSAWSRDAGVTSVSDVFDPIKNEFVASKDVSELTKDEQIEYYSNIIRPYLSEGPH